MGMVIPEPAPSAFKELKEHWQTHSSSVNEKKESNQIITENPLSGINCPTRIRVTRSRIAH